MNKENNPVKNFETAFNAAVEAEKQSRVDMFNAIVELIKHTKGKYLKLSWGIKYSDRYRAADLLILNKEECSLLVTAHYPTDHDYTEEQLINAFREDACATMCDYCDNVSICDEEGHRFQAYLIRPNFRDTQELKYIYDAIMYDFKYYGNAWKQITEGD